MITGKVPYYGGVQAIEELCSRAVKVAPVGLLCRATLFCWKSLVERRVRPWPWAGNGFRAQARRLWRFEARPRIKTLHHRLLIYRKWHRYVHSDRRTLSTCSRGHQLMKS